MSSYSQSSHSSSYVPQNNVAIPSNSDFSTVMQYLTYNTNAFQLPTANNQQNLVSMSQPTVSIIPQQNTASISQSNAPYSMMSQPSFILDQHRREQLQQYLASLNTSQSSQ